MSCLAIAFGKRSVRRRSGRSLAFADGFDGEAVDLLPLRVGAAGGFGEFIVLADAAPQQGAAGGFVGGEECVPVVVMQFGLDGFGAGAAGFGEEGGGGGGALGELGAGGFGLTQAQAQAQAAEILIGLGLAHKPVDVFVRRMSDDFDLAVKVALGFLEPVHPHEEAT